MDNQKSTKLQLVQVILTAVILAVVLVVGVVVVSSFVRMQNTMVAIERDVEALDMDVINEAIESLDGAARELSKVDMESLNSLVKTLDETADSLSGIVNGIGSIFK